MAAAKPAATPGNIEELKSAVSVILKSTTSPESNRLLKDVLFDSAR